MNNLAIVASNKKMSSLLIAEITGKERSHINRDIKIMCEQLGYPIMDDANIQGVTVIKDSRGYIIEILLDKDHALTLITGYDARARMLVNRRWQELESTQPAIPTTFAAALRLAADTQDALDSAILKIEQDKPKVAALERISGGEGSQTITAVAKVLKVAPNELFRRLNQLGWIYRRAGAKCWLGYQKKITQGLLDHVSTPVERSDGSEKIAVQVLVTPKGIVKLSKLLEGMSA